MIEVFLFFSFLFCFCFCFCFTFLIYFLFFSSFLACQTLLSLGASPDPKDKDGHTPLYLACMNAQGEIAKVLLFENLFIHQSRKYLRINI